MVWLGKYFGLGLHEYERVETVANFRKLCINKIVKCFLQINECPRRNGIGSTINIARQRGHPTLNFTCLNVWI